MKCPGCGNESQMLFSDGCLTCHERRTEKLRESLARVESGTAATPKPKPKPKPAVIPPEEKEPKPMPNQQIRWTVEEQQKVATEVARLYPGLPFAAKAIKEAQECLPADRRKPSIGPVDLKKIRALIPGAQSPRASRSPGRSPAKVSRRRAAAAASSATPAILEPVGETLPAAESLADSIAQQLFGAVIAVGVQALEKAAGRLRAVAG